MNQSVPEGLVIFIMVVFGLVLLALLVTLTVFISKVVYSTYRKMAELSASYRKRKDG